MLPTAAADNVDAAAAIEHDDADDDNDDYDHSLVSLIYGDCDIHTSADDGSEKGKRAMIRLICRAAEHDVHRGCGRPRLCNMTVNMNMLLIVIV